ncbi:MAG: FAD-dependent oxidoreductase [Marinobacter sp.]|uniref:NAD(P)/FAD-dependent oxidoreductase n=1 Tax=Marinobacter sp. TaxID=50741 RepID=UPI001B543599|nr:FAD-dependent oxidoreductase [Marinobacter sp.]MBQ0745510.1 FAD-dependent oxidoreductase [Marinobacter sp.]MBQ0813000.1 FAD-dependent oxidoreductase [Marinobacter sp.]|tara:strand:- start:1248 stop:2291 length:1044 start_codon:yes stop_codon:yes gene_type:complete
MFNETFHTTDIRRIAIVGSGLAGLTAAIKLKHEGYDVTVFEKSRGPGGRLAAKRVVDGSVDIGAQYFTSRNPDFLPFLNEFAGEGSFATWSGQFGFQGKDNQWQGFPDEPRYVGTPRMTAISRALSAHATVIAETRIESMVRTDKGWVLTNSNEAEVGVFDEVIITAPPAQARDLLAQSDLPELAAQLDDAVSRVLPCWAVAAHFMKNPWPRHEGMRCDNPVLFWVANNSSKPGRASADQIEKGIWWVLHANPEWTERNVDASPDRVKSELIAAFRELTGTEVEVTEALSHRWLYARSEGGANPGHLWFPEQGIGVAGDWLSGGRVEGAFDSACSLVTARSAKSLNR